MLVACGGSPRAPATADDPLAARFPLAGLDDRALCDRLLARTPVDFAIAVDPEPAIRRKVIVSDLHLGPGADPKYAGIEDFYSDAAWSAFLKAQAAAGPTDLVIAGDFVEFWQIASVDGALPRRDDRRQPDGPVLAEDQRFAVGAVNKVISAHPTVFRDLGALLAAGDHRVIVVAGNHDADLLWPEVQLAIARAIAPKDPARLVFVDAAAYEHAGVHVEHGHAYDAANRFEAGHAPFGRDRDGTCRVQSSWGEIFVDQFYTDVERRIPFIDNLYPESAAILWTLREDRQTDRDAASALKLLELIRVAETGLDRNAAGAILQNALGVLGARGRGPESMRDVVDHLSDRLVSGDASAKGITTAALRLYSDPALHGLWHGLGRAAAALPDVSAALDQLRAIDRDALARLHELALGDPMENAARKVIATRDGIRVVVFGHTHQVGGALVGIDYAGRKGYYANTGSWLSVASVADLRARGITWDRLNLADRAMFPSKTTAVIVEYDGKVSRQPIVWNAP